MFKIFRSIFSSPENGSEIIRGAKEGLDALVFTDQEKSEMGVDAFKLYLEWLKATQGHNVSRRFIAIVVVMLWAFLVLIQVFFKAIEVLFDLMDGMSAFVFTVMTDQVAVPFGVVVGFYFATQLLQRAIGASKNGK